MLHQPAVTHDPRAVATPSQLKAADERRARQARFSARALNAPAPAPKDKTYRPDPLLTTAPKPADPPPPEFKEPWFSVVCEIDLQRPSIDDLIRIVARRYDVTRRDILSPRRSANIVKPRQVAAYLAKTLTLKSLPEIGRRMDRDHTSILHGIRKIERLLLTDSTLAAEIAELIEILQPKQDAI